MTRPTTRTRLWRRPFGAALAVALVAATLVVPLASLPAGAVTPLLDSTQTGTATLSGGSSFTSAVITAVDTTRSFLVFSVRESTGDPAGGTVSGRLDSATSVVFDRIGTTGTVTIEWSVVSFTAGVTVQRGTTAMGAATVNVPISAVDLTKSFPIVSMRVAGTVFSDDDFVRSRLTASGNLELSTFALNANVVEWQVIQYDDASVQSGDLSFGAGDMARTATVTAVDASKSWLVYGYRTSYSSFTNIGEKLVRGTVTNNTTLTFDRSVSGTSNDLSWYLIEFQDATTVQHSSTSFLSAETSLDVPITAVDPTRAIAVGGYQMTGGRSPYSANDVPGVGWFTFELTTGTNLRIRRDAALATADASWSVIHWPSNTPPTAAAGTYIIAEGGTLNLDASGSSDPDGDPLTYDWDLDNDTFFDDASGISPSVPWATLVSLGIDDNSSYPIYLRVDDGINPPVTALGKVALTNTAPTLTTTGSSTSATGSVYTLTLGVSDPGDDTISEWVIDWGDGTVDTIAGNPPTATHPYVGIGATYNILAAATDEDGTYRQNDLLVPSYLNDLTIRYEPDGTSTTLEAGHLLDQPYDVAIGPGGDFYVTGFGSNEVARYDGTTGAWIARVISGVDALGLAFGPNGNLYVASYATSEILEYDGTTFAPQGPFVTAGSGGLTNPAGITFGPDGNLYVSAFSDSAVNKYNGTTGASMGLFVAAGDNGLATPEDLAFGPDGDLYVTDSTNNNIQEYRGTDGLSQGVFNTGLNPSGAIGLVFGPDGYLYVASYYDNDIHRFNATTGAYAGDEVIGGAGGLDGPAYLTLIPEQQVTVTPIVFVNSTGDGTDTSAGDGQCNTGGLNADGDPECTLRAAIEETNALVSANPVAFAIPTSDPGYSASPISFTIQPASVLPAITQTLDLDASTQPEHLTEGRPVIEIDGSIAGAGVDGLVLTSTGSTVRGFAISRFTGTGIQLTGGSANTVAGNHIGTDVTGLVGGVGNDDGIYIANSTNNVIGGTGVDDGNVISGNRLRGVFVDDSSDGPAVVTNGTRIIGNLIGTDAAGAASLPYSTGPDVFQQMGVALWQGVDTEIGSTAADEGNVISGNSWHGVYLWGPDSSGNTIEGNIIGLDSTGSLSIGNGFDNSTRSAVLVHNAPGTRIGGDTAPAANTIAGNDSHGVVVNGDSATSIAILRNRIYDNTGIGIDLGHDDVTLNDPGDLDGSPGPNELLNFPLITSATESGGTVTVTFDLDVPAGNHRVEFFTNPGGADLSGHGEGESYESAVVVAAGVDHVHAFPGTIGDVLSATATAQSVGPVYGSTSEFSATHAVTAANPAAVWRRSGSTTPFYAGWDGATFGSALPSQSVGEFRVIQGAEAPTRDEAIVLGMTDAGTVAGEMWNGTAWTALPFNNLVTGRVAWNWGLATAYESLSGDGIIVWNNGTTGTTGLSYRVWDGATWSGAQTITAPISGEPVHMMMAASPRSDDMTLVVSNDAGEDYAIVWDGSSWGNSVILDGGGGDSFDIDVAYEQLSGTAVVVDSHGTDSEVRRWNGTVWSGAETITRPGGMSGNPRWNRLAGDPTSDRIALGVRTYNNDVWLAAHDGTSWTTVAGAASTPSGNHPGVDVAFEGTSGQAIAAYGISSNSVAYRTWPGSGAWSAQAVGPDVGAVPNSLALFADPTTDEMMLATNDAASDINMTHWSGSAWGAASELETTSGLTDYQPFFFLWDGVIGSPPTQAAILVNSTGDSADNNAGDGACDTGGTVGADPECTLRAAIQEANALAGTDLIHFYIPTSDGNYQASPLRFRIPVSTFLTPITDPVVIDGTTQPEFSTAGRPVIVLDGTGMSASDPNGISLQAGSSTIRGLVIQNFGDDGIEVEIAGGNTIVGNYIGTDVTGALDRGNGYSMSVKSSNNVIGGTTAADRNVIAGNVNWGIGIYNSASGNQVEGNYIGVDTSGATALGNGGSGVDLYGGANGNTLGGSTPAHGNVISGNGTGETGILITGATTSGNTVRHNFIGTNAAGDAAIPNNLHGLVIDDAPNTQVLDNLISGNDVHGIYLNNTGATGTQILRNTIGSNLATTAPLPNGFDGVRIEGWAGSSIIGSPGNGNVIAGNAQRGINLNNSNNNTIQANSIGTNTGGSIDLGNTLTGVYTDAWGSSDNLIGGAVVGEGTRSPSTARASRSCQAPTTRSSATTSTPTTRWVSTSTTTVVTPNNNADTWLDYPLITSAVEAAGTVTVDFDLDVPSGDYRIEIFTNPSGADATGFGEGETYETAFAVVAHPGGSSAYSTAYTGGAIGDIVTATATEESGGPVFGSTSEFSNAYVATAVIAVSEPDLWISTAADVGAPSGAPGLTSWSAGALLGFGDPGFALEPGGTAGNFSLLADLDAQGQDGDVVLIGLDLVDAPIAVGGSPSVALQAGDLLLSTANNETFVNWNATTTLTTARDVILFRPRTPSDYTSGTFSVLLADPLGGNSFDFSLLESTTTIGDITLPAGTFVLADGGKIFELDPIAAGPGQAPGTPNLLVDGTEVNVDQNIVGLQVIDDAVQVDGVDLYSGDLLLSIDNTDSTVGDNNISVVRQDIFQLRLDRTTGGIATASGRATMIFDGSDVGLDVNNEDVSGLLLVGGTPITAPVAADDDVVAMLNASVIVAPFVNDADPNGDPLSLDSFTQPTNGTVVDNGDGTFTYTPDFAYAGPDSFTYTVTDGSETDTATVNVDVRPPELRIATIANVVASGTTGITDWTTGDLLSIGDPGLVLEPGTSGGTFDVALDLNAFSADGVVRIDAAHRVTAPVTIGAGGGSFDLEVGDLVLATTDTETLVGTSTSIVTANKDISVFRPTSPGSPQEGGEFFLLLDDPSGGSIDALTVVEHDTIVGDTVVSAGTILLVHSGNTKIVSAYETTTTGELSTTGTLSSLADLSDVGLGGTIDALDLVERNITVGGRVLVEGTILATADGSTTVGTNTLPVDRQDIFAVTATQTTFMTGTTVATASMIFDGSDAALDVNTEDPTAFSIFGIADQSAGNSAPVAVDDVAATGVGQWVIIDVVGNDTDVDLDTLTVEAVTDGANGTVVDNGDGTVTYTRDALFVGVDTFGYRINDGNGSTDTAIVTVNADPSTGALAVWRTSGSTIPQYSEWDGTTFGPTQSSANVGEWRIIQGAEAPTRDEAIVVGVDASNIVRGEMWNGSTWSALPFNPMATVSESFWWATDVGYEGVSGDAVAIWNNGTTGTAGLTYRVWDGATWTAAQTITTPLAGEPKHFQLVPDPRSDRMMLVVSNNSSQDYAMVWDGNAWGNSVTLSASGTGDDRTDVNATWQTLSGDAVVVYGKGATSAYARTWNGASWSSETTITPAGGAAGTVRWTMMASDPGSDRTALAVLTNSNDVWLAVHDGVSWGSKQLATSIATGSTFPNVAIGFESGSGDLLTTYANSTNNVQFRVLPNGGSWSAEQVGPNVGSGQNSMVLYPDPNGDRTMLATNVNNSDLNYVLWDGDAWGTPYEPTTNTGEVKNQPFLFLWDANQGVSRNTAPTLNPVGAQSVDETVLLSFTATAIDTDLPADNLTFSLEDGVDVVPAGVAITAGGNFAWTPTETQGSNSYSFKIRVTDDGTGTLFDEEEIVFTVNDTNTAPTLDPVGPQAIDENTLLSFTATASDTDNPADTLTFSLEDGTDTVPAGAGITAGGDFTWTPSETQGGAAYSFKIRVTDNGTGTLFDEEEIVFAVNDTNTAPTLDPVGPQAIDENTLLSFTATASDSDVPADTLTFSLEDGTDTVPAGAGINAGGDFTWTPTEAQGGNVYSFKIRVTDNGTGTLFDEEEIVFTINEVNVAPVLAAIGDQAIAETVLLAFTISGADTDVPADTLTYSAIGLPLGATLGPTTGDFAWTPTAAQGPGVYPVTFIITDDGAPAWPIPNSSTSPSPKQTRRQPWIRSAPSLLMRPCCWLSRPPDLTATFLLRR